MYGDEGTDAKAKDPAGHARRGSLGFCADRANKSRRATGARLQNRSGIEHAAGRPLVPSGDDWSAWQGNGVTVTVTEPPPPMQTPIELTVSTMAGDVLNWSSLFDAASGPNGATITEYWVTAGNPSVGQWDLNGQPVSGAVTPAQLSELTFDALTPGSETIYRPPTTAARPGPPGRATVSR